MPEDLSTEEYLPIFVFGTLRPGQDNHRLFVRGKTVRELPAALPGHAMFVLGQYPCITEDAGDGDVTGHLLYLLPELFREALAALDDLEGYRPGDASCDYVRVQRTAHALPAEGPAERVSAWVYVAGAPARALRSACPPVPGGDWLVYLAEGHR